MKVRSAEHVSATMATHRNKSVATITLISAFVVFANSALRLNKLNAGYHNVNVGSARVFEKYGFEHQGTKVSDIDLEITEKLISRLALS